VVTCVDLVRRPFAYFGKARFLKSASFTLDGEYEGQPTTTENPENTERKTSPVHLSKGASDRPGHFAKSPLAFRVFRVFRGSNRRFAPLRVAS
jgi:hypothetical protein